MNKSTPITAAAIFAAGVLGGAYGSDIGAKSIDRWVTVQKVVTAESDGIIRSVLAAEACPDLYESHGSECDLSKDIKEVRFDWFMDGDSRRLRMHARFLLPGTFKAE